MRPRAATTALLLLLVPTLAACGSSGPSTSASRPATAARPRPVPPGDATGYTQPSAVTQARNQVIDNVNAVLRRAAAAGDARLIRAAERRLDQLADPSPPASRAHQPFDQFVDEFRFKQGPLYAQQLTTDRGSHRVYVSVLPGAFCLPSPARRVEQVASVYGPAFRTLADHGVGNLEMDVVALSNGDPAAERPLATGRRGTVRLTAEGRRC